MNTQHTRSEFEGQDFWVGMDVHHKDWKVTIRTMGIEVKTMVMPPDPAGVDAYLRRHYPGGRYHSVYEAGFSGFWAHRQLEKLGFDNRVVHAADVPTSDKERRQKEDSAYRHWSGAFLRRLDGLCTDPGPRADYLRFSLEAVRQESCRLAAIMRRLRAHCREGKAAGIVALLKTVPGIGPKAAFTLYTELQDITRFPNLDRLDAYIGLMPSTVSSGESEKTTGITCRRHRLLRTVLIESAWMAIRHDLGLQADFLRLARRMKKQAAIVRIARKLAARAAYACETAAAVSALIRILQRVQDSWNSQRVCL